LAGSLLRMYSADVQLATDAAISRGTISRMSVPPIIKADGRERRPAPLENATDLRRAAATGPQGGPGNRLIGCLHPFRAAQVDVELPEGQTIEQMILAAGGDRALMRHGHAWLNDPMMTGEPVYIPRDRWRVVRPKPGMVVTVRIAPGKEGGGKMALQIVMTIAVIVASIYLGPEIAGLYFSATEAGFATASAIATAVVGLAGTLAISALIPPPQPKFDQLAARGGTADKQVFSINGTQNRANLYGAVPSLFGRKRIYPPLAVEPYREVVGGKVFWRMMLAVGYGGIAMSDIRLGETPIENYGGIETEIREGLPTDAPRALYSDDQHSDDLNAELTAAAGWVVRETLDDIDELAIDWVFPQGLGRATPGGHEILTVAFDVQYAPAGTEDWVNAAWADSALPGFAVDGHAAFTDSTVGAATYFGNRVKVAKGRYAVRQRRTTQDFTQDYVLDSSFWATLRSIKYRDPIAMAGVATFALRAEASSELNGVLDQINMIAERKMEIWDEGTASWVWATTRSPADAFIRAARGAEAGRAALVDARLDMTGLLAWRGDGAEIMDDGQPRWTFDAYYESVSTIWQVLTDIAAAARARIATVDGKWGVVRDLPQAVRKQHVTRRNIWGFEGSLPYVDLPHALKVRYDKDGLGQLGERIVYADGFDDLTATKFDSLDGFGWTDPNLAWREGRYHLAVIYLRPGPYSFFMDPEHMVFRRGDLIGVTHDVPGWGLGDGRIKGFVYDDPDNPTAVTAILVDAALLMENGKDYAVEIRTLADPKVYRAIETAAGWQTTLTFLIPIPVADSPAAGDLVAYGLAGSVSVDALVKEIEPGPDLSARITVVDAAPAVHDADTGPIPAFDPQITRPPVDQRKPPMPMVVAVKSDESVLIVNADTGFTSRILVTLGALGGAAFMPDYYDVKWRRSDSTGGWQHLGGQPIDATAISIMPVDDKVDYAIEIRTVTRQGQASDPATFSHTVIGQSTRPPAPTDARVENGVFRGTVPLALPIDFRGYIVRTVTGTDTNWDAGSPPPGHDANTVLPRPELDIAAVLRQGGARVLMMKSVDWAGNESDSFISAVIDLGAPIVENIVIDTDLAAAGFPGTIAGGAVDGGVLKADDDGSAYLADPTAPYLPDPAAAYLDVTYLPMTYEFTYTPDAGDLPGALVVTLEAVGVWTLEYRSLGTGLAWDGDGLWEPGDGPFLDDGGGSWVPWPGRLDEAQAQPYFFRIRWAGGAVRGELSALNVKLDVPDEQEWINDVALAVGTGSRLALTKSYRSIKGVAPVLIPDAGTARTIRLVDYDPDLGPLLEALDTSGAVVAATVTAFVQGVRA
jgi:hypothetical protein